MNTPAVACATAILLAGCAGLPADDALKTPREWAARAAAPAPELALDDAARAREEARRRQLLAGELNEAAAVELALRGSPAARALLAEGWQLQAAAAGTASWPRLTLSVERMAQGGELAFTRGLAVGLAELLTLPWRRAAADAAVQVQGLQTARDLLALHAATRQQWVRAVSARQAAAQQRPWLELAEIGAELARRLQAAGQFSPLQVQREQALLADARLAQARAELAATREQEALLRLLGLGTDAARGLRWPERLPELPPAPRDEAAVLREASRERLDLRLAEAAWQRSTRERGLAAAGSLDLELALRRESSADGVARGGELALSLPAPATLALRGRGADAAQVAAAARLDQARAAAASTLREHLAGQQAAHAVALRLRDELLPLRRSITAETLLRYNGMLASVFDLLADARAEIASQRAATEAGRDFWLADAALDAAILGVPATPPALAAGPAAADETRGGH